MNLTGQVLIAHPNLQSPFFGKSVVYIFEHSPGNGAQGFVLNKEVGFPVRDVFASNGFIYDTLDTVHRGGPINHKSLSLFHSGEWMSQNSYPVGNYCVTSDKFMLEKMATGTPPVYWRMVSGVSGWGPGQLEAEVKGIGPFTEKSWLTLSATDSILFEYDGEQQWQKGIDLCSQQMIEQYF